MRGKRTSSGGVANTDGSSLTAGSRRLCGRDRELAFFRDALAGTSAPFSVLYVYGLGGVGKSALVDACVSEASRKGIATLRLDARHVEPTPHGFLGALDDVLGLGDVD